MANVVELNTIIQIAGKIDQTFLSATRKAEKEMGLLGTVGSKAFFGLATAATALVGSSVIAGKKLYDLGAEFDSAEDKIRIGTGATGEALTQLMNNAKAVYSQVPTTLEDTSTVISDYNTRLGITGNALEQLSTQALQVSNILDEDVASVVENSSRAFKNFGVAENEMSSSMDYAFKVSQSTGIGFNELLSIMQTGGAQLQAMGFGFNESATLLGQFTKNGYDTNQMLMGLKTTAQQAIKDGFGSTSEAMNAYIDKIKNAKSDTEALAIANQKFGSRGGATFLKAIKDGTLNIKELQTQLESSDESIKKASEDTYDFGERWTMFKNKMNVALQPVANSIFNQIGTLAEAFLPVIENDLLPVIQSLQPLIEALAPIITSILKDALGLLKTIFDILTPIINGISKLANWINDNSNREQAIANDPRLARSQRDIPAFAEGGIVNKPTLAMVGEGNEPEAIIPFSKMGNSNSITYSPTIQISGDVSNDRAKEIAQISFEEFKRLYKRMMNENRRLSFATV